MALIHTCMHLKNDGYISSFDMHGSERAVLYLSYRQSINVYIAKDYTVGVTEIREAASGDPEPDYIVYNQWDKVTDEAFAEAKRHKIKIVHYMGFREILSDYEH